MRTTLSILLLLVWLAGSAPAQDTTQDNTQEATGDQLQSLRAENAALQARVAELESSLAAIRTQLEAILRALPNQRVSTSATTPHPQQSPALPLPTDPTSCPDALFAWLVESYNHRFPRFDSSDAHRAVVKEWATTLASTSMGRVRWLVTGSIIQQPSSTTDNALVNLRVFDDATGRPLGEAAQIRLPAALARTLQADPSKPWILEGQFFPAPIYDPSRPTPGPFNNPPLIGPYAIFGFTFDKPRLLEAPRTITINPDAVAPQRTAAPVGR